MPTPAPPSPEAKRLLREAAREYAKYHTAALRALTASGAR